MKLGLILLSLLFSLSGFALELTGKLYIPAGYDDNDLVEISIVGKLPNLCHRSPGHMVIREGNHFVIQMYAYWVPERGGCRKLSLPYQETIRLGMLQEGNYTVSVKGVEETPELSFSIKPAQSSLQDDYLYGNVMGIKENDSNREIELNGTNPVNCLKFHKLSVDVQENVIVIRPLFKQEGICEEIPTPFTLKYKVPYLKKHPKGLLLHVRILNGRSYNYLYQNRL